MNLRVSPRTRALNLSVSALFSATALLLGACDGVAEPAAEPAPPAESPTESPTEPNDAPAEAAEGGTFDNFGAFVPNPRILMAFREIQPPIGAENGFSIRQKNPEEFALTVPPSGRTSLRPMAEWEDMSALLLAFPGEFLSDTNATSTVVGIIKHGSEHGDVWVMVDSSQAESGLRQRLINAGVPSSYFGDRIRFHRTIIDSIWLMDFSPWPIVDEDDDSYAFLDFRYYFDRPRDDGLPTRLGRFMAAGFGAEGRAVTYRSPLTTEGGTLQASTDGVCFTSSRQLFNLSCYDTAPGRGCDESILSLDLQAMQTSRYALEMKAILADYAGCRELVVTHSVSDDGTGHLDMYFKLLDNDRILLGEYRPPFANAFQQENATLMDENAAFLESWSRPGGGTYTVERIIMPGHRVMQGYGQVPFTYLNATFFNGINLWPASDYPAWRESRDEAQATWERVLPDMEHQWIDATNLSFYSGAIHCITRTLPARKIGNWVADGVCESGTCNGPEDGYDGECSGAGTSICYGPAWTCECNDCSNNCQDPCQGVGYEGCCDGGNVVSCENGVLVEYPCGRTGCGWNDWGGYYDCQQSGAEPSGTYPIACAGCEPQCGNRTCGDDGCGGSCGECSDGSACVSGSCKDGCYDCEVGTIGCDGTVAWLCEAPVAGCKSQVRIDCASSGRICQAGDCIDNPNPPADVGPEPMPEEAPEAAEPVEPRKDDGCNNGGTGGLGLLLGAVGMVMVATRRRRAGRLC